MSSSLRAPKTAASLDRSYGAHLEHRHGRAARVLGRYENRVAGAAFSADGSRIVTAGDSSIQVHGTPGRSAGPLAESAPSDSTS
jgi:hypothetical protein